MVAARLGRAFEKIRQDWFKVFDRTIMEATLRELCNKKLNLQEFSSCTKGRALGGDAEFAMKAFQLLVTRDWIKNRSYLPPTEVDLFMRRLAKFVQSVLQSKKLVLYLVSYDPSFNRIVSEKDVSPPERFTFDIIRYVTGRDPLPGEITAVFAKVQQFTLMTQGVVACAFGDEKTAEAIRDQLKQNQLQRSLETILGETESS